MSGHCSIDSLSDQPASFQHAWRNEKISTGSIGSIGSIGSTGAMASAVDALVSTGSIGSIDSTGSSSIGLYAFWPTHLTQACLPQ